METYKSLYLLGVLFATFILYACAPYKFSENRAGMCNEINSQIIFSGSTANTRNAEIESAQAPALQHAYDSKCAK